MSTPIFVKPLRHPGPGEKVYSLTDQEIESIIRAREGMTGLVPGMGGVSPTVIMGWVKGGTPLTSIDLMLTKGCNFRCNYCYAVCSPEAAKTHLTMDVIEKVIRDAAALGVHVFILTGGEPLVFRDGQRDVFDVMDIIQEIYSNDDLQSPLLAMFSDVALITPGKARGLLDRQVSLCLKRDSLFSFIQDDLIQFPGGMKKMEAGYQCLFDAGYGKPGAPTTSVNSVFSRFTLSSMVGVHIWVRAHGMEHSIIPIHYCGSAENDPQKEGIHSIHVKALYDILAELDEILFNDRWVPYSAFIKYRTCNRRFSGLHIRATGDVTSCSESPSTNLEGTPLKDYTFGNVMNGDRLMDIAGSERLRRYRAEYRCDDGEYICNSKVCDLYKNGLCSAGCAVRAAYSAFDPETGLIVPSPDRRRYTHGPEDYLCPALAILAAKQGILRPGIYERIIDELLATLENVPADLRKLFPANLTKTIRERCIDKFASIGSARRDAGHGRPSAGRSVPPCTPAALPPSMGVERDRDVERSAAGRETPES